MTNSTLFTSPVLTWLDNKGKNSDVVLASRVRLARNLKNIPFPNRAKRSDLIQVKELILRLLLSDDLSVSIMVNEDDHLRIQCRAPGLDLDSCLKRAFAIDDAIEAYLNIAFDEKMGYLTAYPTNLGTGLRATVLLHLPALVITQQISKIINISPQLGMTIRGLFGEDSLGNLFQASNQLTLGFKEEELIENLSATVQEIVSHEHDARKALLSYSHDKLENRVWRSFGILKYAHSISQHEMLNLVSKVRLGVDMGIIDETKADILNLLLIAGQKNYLQNLNEMDNMTPQEIEKQRATTIRNIFSQLQNTPTP